MSPLDVPSGVGQVTSAAYCMPTGSAGTRKNPSTSDAAISGQRLERNATPRSPGMAKAKHTTR